MLRPCPGESAPRVLAGFPPGAEPAADEGDVMARRIIDDIVESPPQQNAVREQIEAVRHLIRAVGRGDKLMQLICSESGLGKTWIVGHELKKLGIKVEPLAPANDAAFVKALYDHR